MDNGLLGGLAAGLQSGMQAYNTQIDRQQKVKRYQDELDFKNLAQQKGLLESGMTASKDPDSGQMNVAYTPQKQGLIDLQNQAAQTKANEEIPGSDTNLNLAKAFTANGAKGDLSQLPSSQMKEVLPLVTANVKGDASVDAAAARAEAAGDKQQKQQDFMAHQRNLMAIKKDPVAAKQLTQYNNLQGTLNNIANPNIPLTPEMFDEMQRAVRSNLGIQSGSGVSERDKSTMDSLGLHVDRMSEFLTANPKDIGKDSSLAKHMKDLAASEIANIQAQHDARLKFITGGNTSVYDRRPDLQRDLEGLTSASNEQYTQPKGLIQTPQQAAVKPPKNGDVIDGWTFLGGDPADKKNWRK